MTSSPSLRPQPQAFVANRGPIDAPGEGTCCITWGQIRDLHPHQIFTTADGKNYDRLALKEWLTHSNKIPHSNVPSLKDTLALYERDISTRRKALTALCGVVAVLMGAALVCSSAQQRVLDHFLSQTDPLPHPQAVQAHHFSMALLNVSMALFAFPTTWIIARELKRELSLPEFVIVCD